MILGFVIRLSVARETTLLNVSRIPMSFTIQLERSG
jgi:hypothetical protein